MFRDLQGRCGEPIYISEFCTFQRSLEGEVSFCLKAASSSSLLGSVSCFGPDGKSVYCVEFNARMWLGLMASPSSLSASYQVQFYCRRQFRQIRKFVLCIYSIYLHSAACALYNKITEDRSLLRGAYNLSFKKGKQRSQGKKDTGKGRGMRM